MIDIKFLRENPDVVKENIKKRNVPIAELNRDRYVIAQNLINVYSGEYGIILS